jgi:uncharacterized membrane protein AbrB (regulator of aidB expression)
MAAGSASGSFNTWLWVLGAPLIAVTCYGLWRTLFVPRPSLAAATTVAVSLSIGAAVALELLRYHSSRALGFPLSLFTAVACLGIFSFVLGRYIHRARPAASMAAASIAVGLFVLLLVGVPLMIYIGCQFGECINL